MKTNKLTILFVLVLSCSPLISSPSSALKERSHTITYGSGTSIELTISLDSLLLDTGFISMHVSVIGLNLPHEITDIVVKVRFSKSPDTHSTLSIVYLSVFHSSVSTPSILQYDKKWGSSRLEAYIEWNEPSYHIYSEWMYFFSVRPNNLFNRYNYVFIPAIVLVSSVTVFFLYRLYFKKWLIPSKCHKCEHVIKREWMFCRYCGFELKKSEES